MWRSRRFFSGQSVVEFALIVPIFALLLMGIVDFGRVFYAQIAITNAARTAALHAVNYRLASPYTTADKTAATNLIRQVAIKEAAPFVTLTTSDVTVTSTWTAGERYSVTVTTRFAALTPIISQLWGGGTLQLSESIELRHSCDYLSVATPSLCAYPAP